MIDKIVAAVLILIIGYAGYLAITQSLEHKATVPAPVKEVEKVRPPVELPPEKPAEKPPEEPKPPPVVVPPAAPSVPVLPKEPEKTNHVSVKSVKDHSIVVGFISGLWPIEFPQEGYNKEALQTLFKVLKAEKVQMVFLADAITFSGNIEEAVKRKLKTQLADIFELAKDSLGENVSVFPVIECSLSAAEQLNKIIFHAFEIDLKDQMKPFDISINGSSFVVAQTHGFEPQAHIVDAVRTSIKSLEKKPQLLFVVGYDAAFPVASVISNDHERKVFWGMLAENKVKAYFSFGEKLFNRLYEKGVWQVITGTGETPTSEKDGSPPFYHAVLLRIPALPEEHPTVQVLDKDGEVIDEFDLKENNSPLHQYHISLAS